jgi:FixJ family two-component response regulator
MTSSEETVFIVDDDASVRRSTERLVRAAGFKVESFVSAGDFLKQPPPSGVACLILDVQMPGLSGMDLQEELSRLGMQIPIIFITAHGDIPMTVKAMKGGAVEFLTKPFDSHDLLEAIRAAIERDREAQKQRRESKELRERYDHLTPREREVICLIVSGMLNKQVAAALSTTERTIKFHRSNIMQKMKVESLAELVSIAGRLGIRSQRK